MEKKILFVLAIEEQGIKFWGDKVFNEKIVAISQYKLDDIDFNEYSGIILSLYVDQYLLLELKEKLKTFLNNGNKIFLNGHIFKPFLEELNTFIPIEKPKLKDFKITQLAEHTVYKGIDVAKLFKRKGVAGFFGRGMNPPPKGANNIIAIKNGQTIVDWEYKINTGALYVHSGNDLWACMECFEDNFKLFKNIIEWIEKENHE